MTGTIQAPPSERRSASTRAIFWLSGPFLALMTAAWRSITYHFRDPIGPELLLLGLLVAGLLLVATGSRTGLLSPVFYYDLVRTARRGQLHSHRFLFTVFLAAALFLVYATYIP